MASTDRQNRLLLAEDWTRIYQSYKNAEFKSYDFDTIRRTMIQYIRSNYPEDFNDYIESSEYLALIDLIAFLGQNVSFRIDLIFFLSPELKIFLEIPPPFGVFGIKTIYLPAIDIKVDRAAPFNPRSSFNT